MFHGKSAQVPAKEGKPREMNTGVYNCTEGPIADVLKKTVGNIFAGLGDVTCAVFQKAINVGLDIASMAIPGGQAVSAAEKAAVIAIKKATGAVGKSGIIEFCAREMDNAIPI